MKNDDENNKSTTTPQQLVFSGSSIANGYQKATARGVQDSIPTKPLFGALQLLRMRSQTERGFVECFSASLSRWVEVTFWAVENQLVSPVYMGLS